jgi:hypothetical protein
VGWAGWPSGPRRHEAGKAWVGQGLKDSDQVWSSSFLFFSFYFCFVFYLLISNFNFKFGPEFQTHIRFINQSLSMGCNSYIYIFMLIIILSIYGDAFDSIVYRQKWLFFLV